MIRVGYFLAVASVIVALQASQCFCAGPDFVKRAKFLTNVRESLDAFVQNIERQGIAKEDFIERVEKTRFFLNNGNLEEARTCMNGLKKLFVVKISEKRENFRAIIVAYQTEFNAVVSNILLQKDPYEENVSKAEELLKGYGYALHGYFSNSDPDVAELKDRFISFHCYDVVRNFFRELALMGFNVDVGRESLLISGNQLLDLEY